MESVKRIRGRRWMEMRRHVLAGSPLCVVCERAGFVELATEVDHIIPLAQGGSNDYANLQALCSDCHADKTRHEFGECTLARPAGLPRSKCPLEIVCGPPGAGKSYYVGQHAGPDDVAIDLDGIEHRLFGTMRKRTPKKLAACLRERNTMLRRLALRDYGRAYFIVSCPTRSERDWWLSQLGGTATMINPGYSVCLQRLHKDGRGYMEPIVRNWYQEHSKERWA